MSAASPRLLSWLAAVTIAATLIGGVAVFFTVDVCDEQLADSGQVVMVCRHLQASDPPVVAAGVVVVVLLGAFFSEISGFGITLKRRVDQLAATTAASAKDSSEAKSAAAKAIDLADDAIEGVRDTRAPRAPGVAAAEGSPLLSLADEYRTIRQTMPSGHERTQAMEEVVQRMHRALEAVDDFDVAEHLRSDHRGMRLAGFVSLCARPQPGLVPELLDAVFRQRKPFEELWALRALRAQVEADRTALDAEARRRLNGRLAELPPGSDRARELRKLLDLPGS